MPTIEAVQAILDPATLVSMASALIAALVAFPAYRSARSALRQASAAELAARAAEQQNRIGVRALQAICASTLLSKSLEIQAQLEAWILEGPNYRATRLSEHKNLPTAPSASDLWLRAVEVRAVFDEGAWNSIGDKEYGFLAGHGRRLWIIRDVVLEGHDYVGPSGPSEAHPALLSSRPLEEMAGWAEEVRLSLLGGSLTRQGLAPLEPFLQAICLKPRVEILKPWLLPETRRFLLDFEASPQNLPWPAETEA